MPRFRRYLRKNELSKGTYPFFGFRIFVDIWSVLSREVPSARPPKTSHHATRSILLRNQRCWWVRWQALGSSSHMNTLDPLKSVYPEKKSKEIHTSLLAAATIRLHPENRRSRIGHYLTFATWKLASSADNVYHLVQLVRGTKLGSAPLVTVVRLSRTTLELASTVFHIDHTFLFVRGAEFSPLPIHTVRRLSRTFVVLTPEKVGLSWVGLGTGHRKKRKHGIYGYKEGQRLT